MLNLVSELQAKGARVLLGNHEAIMLNACRSGLAKPWNHWVGLCGGEATLASYGYQLEDFEEAIQSNTLPSFIKTLPKLEEHLQLIETFEIYIELEDAIFVHGGVVPDVAIAETDPMRLLWIREEFHAGYQGKKRLSSAILLPITYTTIQLIIVSISEKIILLALTVGLCLADSYMHSNGQVAKSFQSIMKTTNIL